MFYEEYLFIQFRKILMIHSGFVTNVTDLTGNKDRGEEIPVYKLPNIIL